MSFPPPPNDELNVFESLPPPTQATFNAGLRATMATTEELLSIILYSPNLQLITSLDNTNSTTTSRRIIEVSRGFAFGTSQGLSITQSAGVDFLWLAAEVSINFSITFTQEWTRVETRSIEFVCPPRERLFAYQGTLMSRVLQLSASTGQFSWNTHGSQTSTEVFSTHSTPLNLKSMSSDAVRIEQS